MNASGSSSRASSRSRSARRSTISISSPSSSTPCRVASPARHDRRRARDLPVVRQLLAHHRQQPFGDAVRALRAQPRDRVAHLRVREALDQRLLVLGQVDPRHLRERRRRLLVHVAREQVAEQRVLRRIVHEPVAAQVAEVRDRLVARVEQPELHQLIGLDVVDDLHADVLVRRPPGAELVLQHPLGERLAHHRPAIVDPEARAHLLDVLVGGRGRDAVDHAVGERDALRDPVAELRVAQACEGGERRAREPAVALQVVARHDRERLDLALAPPPQRLGHEPEHRLRRPVRLEVRHHRRVVLDELAGRVVEVVAALGHGQRHDPRLRRGELLEHRLGVVGRVQVLDDRADRPRVPRAVGVLDDQRVAAVLLAQDVAHLRVGLHHADPADAPVERLALVHEAVVVHRHVRAVEAADAEVHHPGRHVVARVVRYWNLPHLRVVPDAGRR